MNISFIFGLTNAKRDLNKREILKFEESDSESVFIVNEVKELIIAKGKVLHDRKYGTLGVKVTDVYVREITLKDKVLVRIGRMNADVVQLGDIFPHFDFSRRPSIFGCQR